MIRLEIARPPATKPDLQLVEQNVRQTLTMFHATYVLENGRVILERSGQALIANKHVKEFYLGI